jgi:hypothetical protein
MFIIKVKNKIIYAIAVFYAIVYNNRDIKLRTK